ncbi:MerR family transcriptional regulator [Micromonospora sp. NPDC049799]|uniref:MerR family transcriptional regulator n=1 Tax=Micromonospora sp. NPDC049799 TaxID=3154741 RepID=UPI0033C4D01C
MDGDALHSIGDLARRTGLTVKAIRFYSDHGIVPPTGRTPAGHRRYGTEALARLDLVRTLRELGLDLSTVRKVVDRDVSLPEVAAAHAEALTVQIRTLRLRRAVLTAIARRGTTPEEMDLMHRLTRLTSDRRRQSVDEFLDAVFGGLDADGGFAGIMRSMTPDLPDDPDADQVAAWIELAELSRDPDFRASLRRVVEHYADDRAAGGATGVRRDALVTVHEAVRPALAAGIDAAAPEADRVVATALARYADLCGHPDGVDLRRRLLSRLEAARDPRRERYLHLLSIVNGWPAATDSLLPAVDWLLRALQTRPLPSTVSGDAAGRHPLSGAGQRLGSP